jgi:hypothetical protein
MIGSAPVTGYPENGSDEDPLLRTEVYLFFLLRLLLVISKAPSLAHWRGSFFARCGKPRST